MVIYETIDLIKTRVASWIKANYDLQAFTVEYFKFNLPGLEKRNTRNTQYSCNSAQVKILPHTQRKEKKKKKRKEEKKESQIQMIFAPLY